MGIPAHVPTLTSKYIISTTGLYSTTTGDVTWFVCVCVCAVLTQNQRRAATNESRRAKVLLHGRVAAVRHHELQWEIIFCRNMPYEFQKVCLLVAPGNTLGISFASLSIVGECWISVLQAVAVKLLRDASHDLALPGIPVLQCQLSCLELFPKSFEPWGAPTTNGTCDSYDFLWLLQFRLHTVQMRNLETRRSAGGDHPPQVKKKTSRYFQWVRNTWSFKVSVSQQTFSYI